RPVRGRTGRKDVPRGRGLARARAAGQAAPSARPEGRPAAGRYGHATIRRADCRGDQRGSGRSRTGGPLPGGPVLSAKRGRARTTTAAGTGRRRDPARRSVPAEVQRTVPAAAARSDAGGAACAGVALLARERARAAERDRAERAALPSGGVRVERA